jgi:hypothetical protein
MSFSAALSKYQKQQHQSQCVSVSQFAGPEKMFPTQNMRVKCQNKAALDDEFVLNAPEKLCGNSISSTDCSRQQFRIMMD